MSKKTRRAPKKVPQPPRAVPTPASAPQAFGYEEILAELEAIVSDAGARNAEEAPAQ